VPNLGNFRNIRVLTGQSSPDFGVLVLLGFLIQAASREELIIAMTTSRSLRVGISFFPAQCLRENLIVDLLTLLLSC